MDGTNGTTGLQITTVDTPSLGDRSYVVSDGRVAVVVDPQRDVDRVEQVLDGLGVRLTHVLETHVHNDYVSGGLELARRSGAEYVLAAAEQVAFDRHGVRDGDVLSPGGLTVRVVGTPGHTLDHLSYVVETPGRQAVFTGGSMLFGATGRTDLVGPEHTQALTRAQHASVRRLADLLAPGTEVFPTHGFGSFCSATPTSGDASTVGEQQGVNPALTLDEDEFVRTLLAGLDAFPAYYARMGPANRQGPAPVDLSPVRTADAAELAARVAAGEWVVDLRARRAFAAGHLPGTLSFELGDSFATYLGWLLPDGRPVTLLAGSADEVQQAQRQLVRIGVDRPAAAATGDLPAPAAGVPPRTYRVADFAELAARRAQGPVTVLDTRRHDERSGGAVTGSLHVPLHELEARIGEVPDGEVWVHCASGYRASVAASFLDRPGRDVVLVDDVFASAAAAGLTTTP